MEMTNKTRKENQFPEMAMPSDVSIEFIQTEENVPLLQNLIGKAIIGVASEWKVSFLESQRVRPALLQMSDEKTVYLIDMVALAES